jgi:hypothetical protein
MKQKKEAKNERSKNENKKERKNSVTRQLGCK